MRWSGVIGYAETVETKPGVWSQQIVEHKHYGDVVRNRQLNQSSGQVNNNINISNSISVVADPYAYENFQLMRYITFKGVKWNISDIDIQHPRIVISLGGVYNG